MTRARPLNNFNLFGFDPEVDPALAVTFKAIEQPIWTQHKALLVQRYLRYFIFVTHHGTYIDGFAGKQYPQHGGLWCAREVLESQPRQLRNFFLCELNLRRAGELRRMVDSQPPPDKAKKEPKRRVEIGEGQDFNVWVDHVLESGVITEKEATFALLDQRMFECRWSTVEKLARHKSGNKIELFYFLPVKWIHRALSAKKIKRMETLSTWWGNDDWDRLENASVESIRSTATRRFKDDLGYTYAVAWPIFQRQSGGAVMYYMIHASDHPEAPRFMGRAYNNALGVPEPIEQLEMEFRDRE